MAQKELDPLEDTEFIDRKAKDVLVISGTTTGFVDDLQREADGMDCSRSKYLLTILEGLGEQGRLDAYVNAKRQRATIVVAEGRGLDV